jgi:prophage regulatory protein
MRTDVLGPYIGLSRSQIYALCKVGEFPRPIRLTDGTSAWITREVDDWLDRRIAAQREVPVIEDDPALVEAERLVITGERA